jgi:hypothetical protein
VKYATHKLTGEETRWLQSKDLFVLDLGSEHAITWEIFRDEFHILSLSGAGGKGEGIYGFSSRSHDSDRVCD